jgi:hypothetical protein
MKLSQGALSAVVIANLLSFSAARAQNDDSFSNQPSSSFQQQEDKIFGGSLKKKSEKAPATSASASQPDSESKPESKSDSAFAYESETASTSDSEAIPKDSLVKAMEDAVKEGAPKPPKTKKVIAHKAPEKQKPDADVTLAGLDDKEKNLTIDNEMATSNADAYNEVAETSVAETKQTQKEIKDLEHQLNSAKTAESRATKNAALQAKRLDLAKRLAKETGSKHARAIALQRTAEKKLARLQSQVEAAEKRAHESQQKTTDELSKISKLQASNKEMSRRLKIAQAQIAREKKKLKSLHDKRSKLARENQSLQRKVATK